LQKINDLIHKKALKIKILVSDVDGVLTNGSVYFGETKNEPFNKFSIYDGFGIVIAHECNLQIVIISGRKSQSVEARFRHLGVDEIHTGVLDKKQKLQEIADRLHVNMEEIAYIGDDLIDLPPMSLVGLKIAPKTAVQEVIERVDYITNACGGEGVLREIVELILIAKDKYESYVKQYL
jgi:3-deoxy-D-manno-octulosonate 8-phosphate phosphatase (KDO 8-P phosphatase)